MQSAPISRSSFSTLHSHVRWTVTQEGAHFLYKEITDDNVGSPSLNIAMPIYREVCLRLQVRFTVQFTKCVKMQWYTPCYALSETVNKDYYHHYSVGLWYRCLQYRGIDSVIVQLTYRTTLIVPAAWRMTWVGLFSWVLCCCRHRRSLLPVDAPVAGCRHPPNVGQQWHGIDAVSRAR